ncbi:hypothetical protein FRB95_007437 [Tulasnella sp. JGI-2019a]|nr:hypothetical protein FRB95_007437 [Tulasnella sp. JGI-2019a]
MPAQRTPFREVSNTATSPASRNTQFPGPLEKLWSSPLDQRSRKRRRVDENENATIGPPLKTSKKLASIFTGTVDFQSPLANPPSRPVLSNFAALRAASTRVKRPRYYPISTLPILQSLVSSHKHDVYKIHSTSPRRTFDLPTAAVFSHASRIGKDSLLAVTTEEGRVEIINTASRAEWDLELPRKSFPSHRGAAFDVKWSMDDRQLATASGDQQSCIMDVETSTVTARFSKAHKSSAKQLQWDPYNPNLLASAGRDGSICLWDLREHSTLDDDLEEHAYTHKPIGTIPRAHAEKKKGQFAKFGSPAAPSITSILYGQQGDGKLYSSCSANGIIKLWDLRQTQTRQQCPTALSYSSSFENSEDSSFSSSTASLASSRARGIVSLALTPCGSTIYALSSGSQIHPYSALTLSIPECPGFAEPFSDPRLRASGFYIRVAVSPCGNWLASGSSGGDAFLWEIERVGQTTRAPPVVLKGVQGSVETTCVDWGAGGMLATCSDDGTVRTWRPDPVRAETCRQDPEASSWNWAVASS